MMFSLGIFQRYYLKKIEIVKASEIEVKPFFIKDFSQDETLGVSMKKSIQKKIKKKELKDLAEHLGLAYNETQIVFAKKLLNAYLGGER